jgi:DNA-binding NtrC family response regulator
VGPSPLKILAVDKEKLLLLALSRACKGRLIDIRTAMTSEQALAAIDHCHFDLFMFDLDLKDHSRLELLKYIDEHCPYVPIIFMTTSDVKSCKLNNAIQTTRKQGSWHLLGKPFSLDRMIGLVEMIFQDQGDVKLCLNSLTHNYDQEKRQLFRRPHVQSVNFSFKTIVDGDSRRISSKGILTDINDGGSGMLAHEQLQPEQVISFADNFQKQNGIVAWSHMIEKKTCRFGIQFC